MKCIEKEGEGGNGRNEIIVETKGILSFFVLFWTPAEKNVHTNLPFYSVKGENVLNLHLHTSVM